MNLTKKFLDDHLRDLRPETFKAVVLLLYEPRSPNLKLTRAGVARWLDVPERVARQALDILKLPRKAPKVVARASGVPEPKPVITHRAKTTGGKLMASIFPEAPEPDTLARKAQMALGEGLTFKRGWKYELQQCREWHDDHKTMDWRLSATTAIKNWCSRGVEFEKTMKIPAPKPTYEVVEKDFSEGWVEKP